MVQGQNGQNQPQNFLLPKLKPGIGLGGKPPGDLSPRPQQQFGTVAENLDVPAPDATLKSLNSIPSIWGHPLSMEMVFHVFNDNHPLRATFEEQWRGLLGAIALAEMSNFRGQENCSFNLRAELLEIGTFMTALRERRRLNQPEQRQDDLVSSLDSLLPEQTNILYQVPPDLNGNTNPWRDIYIWLWNGKPVGMTSPSTLVCPSQDGNWTGLPWWVEGKLRSPERWLTPEQQGWLLLWLDYLMKQLNSGSYQGDINAIGKIIPLVQRFQGVLSAPHPSEQTAWDNCWNDYIQACTNAQQTDQPTPLPPSLSFFLSHKRRFLGDSVATRGALVVLDRPIIKQFSLEQVFHILGVNHPNHPEFEEQWRGMLGAIALAEVRGFFPRMLRSQLIPIEQLPDNLQKALHQFPPQANHTLYSVAPNPQNNNNTNPWREIYLWLWNGQPVGMTSPSTLVCPALDGNWTGLPWWVDGKLCSPNAWLNNDEKVRLWLWLDNLRDELDQGGHGGEPEAMEIIKSLIKRFKESLGQPNAGNPDNQVWQNYLTNRNDNRNIPKNLSYLSQNRLLGNAVNNHGVLIALDRPIKVKEQPSSVRVISTKQKQQDLLIEGDSSLQESLMRKGSYLKDLLILDEQLPNREQWNTNPQDVWVYKNLNFANFERQLFNTKIAQNNDNVQYLEPHQLLLDELYFIARKDALPGALLPQGAESLLYRGRPMTPLLPINPILLNYFTPDDLVGREEEENKINIQFAMSGDEVQVTLKLPLSGIQETPRHYVCQKTYILKPENSFTAVPVLEFWPNFKAEYWRDYYAFYYDAGKENSTFQIVFDHIKETTSLLKNQEQENYEMALLNQFPEFLKCKKKGQDIGLILLSSLDIIQPVNPQNWTVGIDFGSSFTNVYFRKDALNGTPGEFQQLSIEPLSKPITASNDEDRYLGLYEYFMLAEKSSDSPLPLAFPLSSVLTTRGITQNSDRPILDGRIYTPMKAEFNTKESWLSTDLKWKSGDDIYTKLFIRHLALQIIAQAVKNNVNQIQWSISYPSAFTSIKRNAYIQAWQTLIQELGEFTLDNDRNQGLTHLCPNGGAIGQGYYRTESLAIAQYFANRAGRLINTTCIDMGGGTSDISIWKVQQKIEHQCSVKLAGRHIFSEFLKLNPKFLERQFKEKVGEQWDGLSEGKLYAKVDFLLRLKGNTWLQQWNNRGEDKEFRELIQLTNLGIAGLYYYVGIILNTLKKERDNLPQSSSEATHENLEDSSNADKIHNGETNRNNNQITNVFLGGNGSNFLHWISPGGQFFPNAEVDKFLSRMLSKGAEGMSDNGRSTTLSTSPKNEVACGLVVPVNAQLTGLNNEERFIAGEKFRFNGKEYSWDERFPDLNAVQTITEFDIGELEQLPKFMKDFHDALRELGISAESINRINGYQISENWQDNEILWRDTKETLKAMLKKIRDEAGGEPTNAPIEPPFILALKALLDVLGRKWANKWNP